jgi:hypothetical protein
MSESDDKPQFNNVLPKEAQRELMRAAQTPITEQDPLARRKAIDKAVERVQAKWPQFFK